MCLPTLLGFKLNWLARLRKKGKRQTAPINMSNAAPASLLTKNGLVPLKRLMSPEASPLVS